MKCLETVADLQSLRSSADFDGKTVGFVPTMGALHEGHLALIRRSVRENDRTLVSIFVNPTQFNDPKDLEAYPRDLEGDLVKIRSAGADVVFTPTMTQLYPDGYRYRILENDFSTKLCGLDRPGHFDGVLTVVMKLLNLVSADRAYFGEKDFQQLSLIQGMVEAFFMRTTIVPCPTVREADGLAMSSRNLRLSPEARRKAPRLYEVLKSHSDLSESRAALEAEGFEVQYLEDQGGRRFVAAILDGVRLIDNVSLS